MSRDDTNPQKKKNAYKFVRIPAPLTRISILPNLSIAFSTAFIISSGLRTSAAIALNMWVMLDESRR